MNELIFSAGDVVTLKSEAVYGDAVRMTIIDVFSDSIRCIWYDHNEHRFFEKEFPKIVLVKLT